VNAVLRKSLEIGPPTFADASRYIADGYAPVPVRFGKSRPTIGPWLNYRFNPSHADALRYGNEGVGLICASMPVTGGVGLNTVAATWLAAISIDVRDKKLAAEIDALVLKRLRWRDSVTGVSPVRVSSSDSTTLRPFALAPDATPFSTRRTHPYYLPGDKPRSYEFRPHHVEILSRGSMFVASGLDSAGVPFTWRNGDLTAVPRSQLPIMDGAATDSIIEEIEALLETRGKQWL
jgi:hypothetical protein